MERYLFATILAYIEKGNTPYQSIMRACPPSHFDRSAYAYVSKVIFKYNGGVFALGWAANEMIPLVDKIKILEECQRFEESPVAKTVRSIQRNAQH